MWFNIVQREWPDDFEEEIPLNYNVDMQIVTEALINVLKDNGIMPLEPPENGRIELAYYRQKLKIDLESHRIYLLKPSWNMETYLLDDPECFEKIVLSLKKGHSLL